MISSGDHFLCTQDYGYGYMHFCAWHDNGGSFGLVAKNIIIDMQECVLKELALKLLIYMYSPRHPFYESFRHRYPVSIAYMW